MCVTGEILFFIQLADAGFDWAGPDGVDAEGVELGEDVVEGCAMFETPGGDGEAGAIAAQEAVDEEGFGGSFDGFNDGVAI